MCTAIALFVHGRRHNKSVFHVQFQLLAIYPQYFCGTIRREQLKADTALEHKTATLKFTFAGRNAISIEIVNIVNEKVDQIKYILGRITVLVCACDCGRGALRPWACGVRTQAHFACMRMDVCVYSRRRIKKKQFSILFLLLKFVLNFAAYCQNGKRRTITAVSNVNIDLLAIWWCAKIIVFFFW